MFIKANNWFGNEQMETNPLYYFMCIFLLIVINHYIELCSVSYSIGSPSHGLDLWKERYNST